MGKLSRTKGAAFERLVASLFCVRGFTASRRLTECRNGNEGDIEIDAPVSIQCKVGAAPSPWRALREARQAAKNGQHAVAIVKRDREPAVACLLLDDLLEILGTLRTERIW